MANVRSAVVCVGILFGLAALPPAVWAQQASNIAGLVRDTSGAVLPGVTVEASSPALIEKVRTATTDGEGRYNVVDLRPGTYTVTFSLTGFGTVKREGIQLTSGFTATVNADLQVGALQETVTVSGQTPLVDVQNVRRQQVVSRELLDTLPTSTKHVSTLVTLTPGFTGLADVGGRYSVEPGSKYHGKSGTKVSMDGMGIENSSGNSSYQVNTAAVEEMVLQTGGISAEVNADGPVVNVVPKEGSNTFKVTLAGFYSNDSLEGTNVTDALRKRGVTSSNKTLKIWDESAAVGGPVKKDKLWFFGTMRTWGFSRKMAGVFWNQTQHQFLTPPGAERKVVLFTPWVDRPEDRASGRWEWYDSYLSRVTWQVAPRHKISTTFDVQYACNCGSTSAGSMQEIANGYRFDPNRLLQVTWSSPHTSRLLFEAGGAATISQWNTFWMPGVNPDHIAITDVGLGISYGAAAVYRGFPNHTDRYTERFSMSYVTGSHNFKTGVQIEQLDTYLWVHANRNTSYLFSNGTPISITQRATPYLERERAKADMGIYAQDQWAINRLTLNLGLRFDYFNSEVPTQDAPGTPFPNSWPGATRTNEWIAPRTFEARKGVPSWPDLDPRLGMSYDLFGNGRTALKASLGRYVAKLGTEIASLANPLNTSVIAANRSWNDVNRNYVPDCDLGNFGQNGECGALDNQNFGKNNPLATTFADDVLNGWRKRDFNWDFAAEVQHELRTGFSLTGGYYRNTGGYFRYSFISPFSSKVRVTDNLAVTPADFDPYCITAPADPRLPGGGGYQICNLADIRPDKFGQVRNVVKRTSEFGELKLVNDFFNVSFNGRFARGIRAGGGFDTGRSVADRCFVVDSPQELLYCRVVTPFKGQTQLKLYGSLPLAAGIVVSGTYQNMSGPAVDANFAVPTAQIAPSLGRNLSGGVRTATVPLVAPQSMFEDRTTRLDMRVSKIFQVGRYRLQANVDAYNLLNSSSILSVIGAYGPRWLTPASIIDPRIVEIGGQLTF